MQYPIRPLKERVIKATFFVYLKYPIEKPKV